MLWVLDFRTVELIETGYRISYCPLYRRWGNLRTQGHIFYESTPRFHDGSCRFENKRTTRVANPHTDHTIAV